MGGRETLRERTRASARTSDYVVQAFFRCLPYRDNAVPREGMNDATVLGNRVNQNVEAIPYQIRDGLKGHRPIARVLLDGARESANIYLGNCTKRLNRRTLRPKSERRYEWKQREYVAGSRSFWKVGCVRQGYACASSRD